MNNFLEQASKHRTVSIISAVIIIFALGWGGYLTYNFITVISSPEYRKVVEQIDAGFAAKTSKTWKVVDLKVIPNYTSSYYYQYYLDEENGKERFSVLDGPIVAINQSTFPTIIVGDRVTLRRKKPVTGQAIDPNSSFQYTIKPISE